MPALGSGLLACQEPPQVLFQGCQERLVTHRSVFETPLLEPLDSLVVRDEAVLHQVKEVRVESGRESGFRDVILIDDTPLRPDIPSSRSA